MSFKHCFVDCKACGLRITLEIHNYDHDHVTQERRTENLRCPTCIKVSTYSGDDFKTAVLTP